MAYQYYNNNPSGRVTGDCVVRAVSLATGDDWQKSYIGIAFQGFLMGDMPSSDAVWGAYLRNNGFKRYAIPNVCDDCYTISDFIEDHPKGIYTLGTGNHAVTVIDGVAYDAWDSTNEFPIFYYSQE